MTEREQPDAAAARAARLRTTIEELEKPQKPGENTREDMVDTSTRPVPNPRDFINRRMRELDQKE